MAQKRPRNAVKVLYEQFYKNDPERQKELARELLHAKLAKAIYQLRTEAGLTQKDLAKLAGTSHSQISRIEDSDYDGHTLTTLSKITAVFGAKVEVHLSPINPRKRTLTAPSGKRLEIPKVIA